MMLLDNPNGALAFLGRTSGNNAARAVIPSDTGEDPPIDPCAEVDCDGLKAELLRPTNEVFTQARELKALVDQYSATCVHSRTVVLYARSGLCDLMRAQIALDTTKLRDLLNRMASNSAQWAECCE